MRILPVLLLFTLLLGACATPPVVEEEDDAAKPASESFDSAQTVNEDGSITISILWDGEEIGTIEKEKPGDGYSVELMEERGSYAYFSVNVTGLGGYILYGGAHSVYEINPAEKLLVNIFEGTPGNFVTDISGSGELVSFSGTGDELFVNHIIPAVQEDDTIFSYEVDGEFDAAGGGKFSPDGKKLAFAASIYGDNVNTDNEITGLFVIDLETDTVTEITREEGTGEVVWQDNETVVLD